MEGFSNLKVCFTTIGGSRSLHTIYCKAHYVKRFSERTPNGQTLFTVGWPPYVTTELLKELFSRAGHVKDVFLQAKAGPVLDYDDSNGRFKVGYVVMSSKSEVVSALKLCLSDAPVPCPTPTTGMGLWCRQYRDSRPNVESLESLVAMVMAEYDRSVESERVKQEKCSQPDEDGWITVTRKTNKRKLTAGAGEQRKKKKKELVNFYSWQMRETQREEIAKLREKFEEDKQRVASMRAKRKFRPY